MKNKILGIFICMLMITAVLPIAISTEKGDIHKNNDVLNYINEYDKINFQSYPVMSDIISLPIKNDESKKPRATYTPDEFNWMDYNGYDWTTSAKKQLCGDCWDFAAIGTFESIINIREDCAGLNPDLSEQYVLSCLPSAGSCHGGNSYYAFLYMMEETPQGNYHNGAIPESCFLYQGDDDVPCSDKCPNWEDLLIPILDCGSWSPDGSSEDIEAIKTQLMETGPVAAGIKSTDFFTFWGTRHHNSDDVFPYLKKSHYINHIVMLLGWKDDSSLRKGGYWICKNSWGTDWGYDGFFNIEYNALSIDSSIIIWVDYDPATVNWPPTANTGGLYFGDIEEEITFDASDSYDPEDDITTYYWDFGDETNGTGITTTHSYSEQGIYPITLIVTDSDGNTAIDTSWVGVEESIDPPNNPEIDGPSLVRSGQEYDFTFVTTDPNNDNVYYYVDWGEYRGVGEWFGPYESGEEITLSHTWSERGSYRIKVKSKDIYDLESDWVNLEITMPLNQFNDNSLLQRLLDRFPFLEFLFNKLF